MEGQREGCWPSYSDHWVLYLLSNGYHHCSIPPQTLCCWVLTAALPTP